MLDFNHRLTPGEQVATHIDLALMRESTEREPRRYLGASRLGASCTRAVQYELVNAPADPGRELSGRALRIFETGHALEVLVIRWLRLAGFDLYTQQADGGQFGFSALDGRLQGHVDGVFADGPAELALAYPMLFECKTMNAKSWRETVKLGVAVSKPTYAAQIALYQAYLAERIPGIELNPALLVAINKDTAELHVELLPFDGQLAQRMSDRAVQIVLATDAGELLPRGFSDPTHFECKFCAWQDRCWRSA